MDESTIRRVVRNGWGPHVRHGGSEIFQCQWPIVPSRCWAVRCYRPDSLKGSIDRWIISCDSHRILLYAKKDPRHRNSHLFLAPRPGFEPGSQPRQGCMIGHYTIGACSSSESLLDFQSAPSLVQVFEGNVLMLSLIHI